MHERRFSKLFSTFGIFSLLDYHYSSGVLVEFCGGSIYISLIIKDVELFLCVLNRYFYIFIGEMSIQMFAHFLFMLCVLLTVELYKVFYVMDILTLSAI